VKCSMVPPEHVDACWQDVEKYLEGAVKYTHGRYTVSDVYDCIKEYGHTLWIAFDEEGIKAAIVTSFMHYPRKKYLMMGFCGGVEISKWKDPMLKLLRHWAFDNQCDGIEAFGRMGWAKVLKKDGYKPLWQTFQLPAADAGLGV